MWTRSRYIILYFWTKRKFCKLMHIQHFLISFSRISVLYSMFSSVHWFNNVDCVFTLYTLGLSNELIRLNFRWFVFSSTFLQCELNWCALSISFKGWLSMYGWAHNTIRIRLFHHIEYRLSTWTCFRTIKCISLFPCRYLNYCTRVNMNIWPSALPYEPWAMSFDQ